MPMPGSRLLTYGIFLSAVKVFRPTMHTKNHKPGTRYVINTTAVVGLHTIFGSDYYVLYIFHTAVPGYLLLILVYTWYLVLNRRPVRTHIGRGVRPERAREGALAWHEQQQKGRKCVKC